MQIIRSDYLSKIKAVVIDLDGVVWAGSEPVPGIYELLEYFESAKKKVFFMTNNSVNTRADLLAKLNRLKIACDLEHIYASGYESGLFLLERGCAEDVFVIGSRGLKEEYQNLNIKTVSHEFCRFLVVGYSPELVYEDICLGMNAVMRGAKFIACNVDGKYPIENSRYLPGCGAVVGAISSACGRKPDFILGKPETWMLRALAERNRFIHDELLVIGDTLESDIQMANRFGSPSILLDRTEGNFKHVEGIMPSLIVRSLYEIPAWVASQNNLLRR